MILKPISLALADVLNKDSVYLPLTAQHKAKLLEHVPAGEETILTITDSVNTEYVRVKNQQGTITLERGVESGVYKFPKGSCVYFPAPACRWIHAPGGQGWSALHGNVYLQGRRADEHWRARTPRLGEGEAVRSLARHQRSAQGKGRVRYLDCGDQRHG